ncbi:MAG: hypothetical protein F6K21_04500 [Symploca sp. SIO2D2]|nr:hypothetical protein [Symploca sp. SIO2D2]
MRILASSHSSLLFQDWDRMYGNCGNLFSVRRKSAKLPYYAIDNGKFVVWSKGKKWCAATFLEMCDHFYSLLNQPLWIVVPDEVADRQETLKSWHKWEPILRERYLGIPLAFAVQNGMQPKCVPDTADVIFVGGTFEWKWSTMSMWCREFSRVHVARVNSWPRLWLCLEAGAESCDGTGWFKGVNERHDLHLFLAIQAGKLKFPYRWQDLSPKGRFSLLQRYLNHQDLWSWEEEPLSNLSQT